MLITYKQKEIEAALRLLILQSGIALVGKTVDIAFTAGRKESGLSAEVNIEDDPSASSVIGGFGLTSAPVQTPVLQVIDTAKLPAPAIVTLAGPAEVEAPAAPAANAETVAETVAPPAVENLAKSLFG
jgi:hypothetical protein